MGEYLVRTQLQQDVDILVIFEDVLELHDVLVVQGLVDLDF